MKMYFDEDNMVKAKGFVQKTQKVWYVHSIAVWSDVALIQKSANLFNQLWLFHLFIELTKKGVVFTTSQLCFATWSKQGTISILLNFVESLIHGLGRMQHIFLHDEDVL